MSIWETFKNLLTKGASGVSSQVLARVEAAVAARVRARLVFRDSEIAAEVTGGRVEELREAHRGLELLFARRALLLASYTRTFLPVVPGENGQAVVGGWTYHPVGIDPVTRTPVDPETGLPAGAKASFEHPDLLGPSAEQLARRVGPVDPVRTPIVGSPHEIPSADDPTVAALDRGLVLRGLLTEEQLREIHAVGKWSLRPKSPAYVAALTAAKTAEAAVERLRQERVERKAEKRRLAAERKVARAEAVARRRAEDIVFLGRDVSAGLAERTSDVAQLERLGLPVLATPAETAQALELPVPRLRWLAFHSEAVERMHYTVFEVPKRSGGMRMLAAPHEELAGAQRWILTNVLNKLPVELPAHGYVKARSTVTNARAPVGQALVVTLDLEDFFPTITFKRVRGVFRRVGYSPAVATLFALLCTECPRRKLEYDGQPLWVAVGPRALPQGACTSPALSNQIARKLDRRLLGMAGKSGWTYTRYADDLTFSRPKPEGAAEASVGMLLARVRHIVTEEGFAIQEKKGRLQRRSGRQSVTGVVVNDKPGVARDEVRALRAILHNARKTGLAAQNREGRPNFEAWLRGKIAYVCMIDRPKGLALLEQLDALAPSAERAG